MTRCSGLVTVVIPCFNQLAYTKLCIESLCRYTDSPYELVVIDNGSSDGTARYLRGLKARVMGSATPPARFVPLFNPANAGVAAAVNQGIRAARGNFVCYLNNDTIVTRSWLSNMLACAGRGKNIGIVGCVTNLVKNDTGRFPDRDGLRNAAEVQRTGLLIALANGGKHEKARFVHGFCMLISKKVIKTVGLFDESFYPCAGEDIDYSFRAKRAGFSLVNARDAFVFHFWSKATRSRRFNKLYTDIKSVKRRVKDVFVRKWGKAGESFLAKTRVLRAGV